MSPGGSLRPAYAVRLQLHHRPIGPVRRGGGVPRFPGVCRLVRPAPALSRRISLAKDNLTAAEVASLLGLSVHTLSYWRQSGQGPRTIKAGARTLYRRADVEQWLAEVDGRGEPSPAGAADWFKKAVETADRIEAAHTSPWKLASTYALLAIAEALLTQRTQEPTRTTAITNDGELLTVADVAAITRLSAGTLRYWRHTGSGGPPSVKLGRRVMYRRGDVEKWLKEPQ